MTTMTLDDLMALRGSDVYDSNNEQIGSLEQVYIDNESGEPEWVSVKTGFFGTNVNLVPLAGAQLSGSQSLQVAHGKDTVKNAPNVDPDGELSESEERALYDHYGVGYPPGDRDRDVDMAGERDTTARDTSGPETDSAMTVSEEELRVDKTRDEAAGGRVRLRKHVVTEQQTVNVPVEKEVARIEREPVTDANRDAAYEGPALSEEEAEITLSEEEVQVSKTAVPKERISLEKDVVTEQQTVSEDVSREEVEVEGDVDDQTRR